MANRREGMKTYDFDRTLDLIEKRPPRKKLESNLIPSYLQRCAIEKFRKGELVEF
jgi:hypothetical protein